MMDTNRIFVDTNVIVGAWAGKPADQKCLQYLYSLKGKRLYLSSLSVAQFVALFQKKRTQEDIKAQVRYLLTKFNVIAFSEKDVENSLAIQAADLEDNIQYVISQKMGCFHFVTNNIKDYSGYYVLDIVHPKHIRKINQ